MKTFQIDVPDELAADIENAVKSGAFADSSEFLRSALKEFTARRGFSATSAQRVDAQIEAYQRRRMLLERAWQNQPQPSSGRIALTLPALLAAMRESSRSEKPSTSMYFAGADVDHPYFLQSDALGIGIAVLPEDAAKALTRKRHPHQVEVMFVLEGAMRLHIESNEPVVLRKGDYYVVDKNVCHWVTPLENEPGAFAFVKTNPAQEPRGVSCE